MRGALRLAAVNRHALSRGLTAGLTLADARARLPDLVAIEYDPSADKRFLERLADAADRYTPLVAISPPNSLLLDVTGCVHLFGGEAALRSDLLARLAFAGFRARAALAGTPDAAQAHARFGQVSLVAAGDDAKAIHTLPIAALQADAETTFALTRAGLKTIGDLKSRPSNLLSARFGEQLTTALRRLDGREDQRITPRRPVPACIVERHFAEPVARQEDIIGTLSILAGRTATILEQRGEGGRGFEASIFRTDGAIRRIMVETSEPLRDRKIILRLLRDRIDALADPIDPGFGFDLIRLAALHTEPLRSSQSSLDGHEQAKEEAGILIDRLVACFNSSNVLRFIARGSHIPERAEELVQALDTIALQTWAPRLRKEPSNRPLQVFETPQPIETLAEVPDGPPLTFRWRRVTHKIARAEGPERIAAEWWRDGIDALTRDYYRVENGKGCRFWLFRDGLYGHERPHPRWFLHGLFA